MTVRRKTYSSGESLSELLVASLIVSLAMIMLFSGVKVGMDIMSGSREKFTQYNEEMNSYEHKQADYVKKYGIANVTPVPEPTPYSFKINSMDPHK